MKKIAQWWHCKKGATAVEYAFIVCGIAIAILTAIFLTGDQLAGLWDTMGTSLSNANANVDAF